MQTRTFDLVVIGCGPGGEKAARQAAYFGHSVAVVEKAPSVGGAMINTGTLPSKTLRETALFINEFRQRNLYGIRLSMDEDLTVRHFMHREREVVRSERAIVTSNLHQDRITLVKGMGSLEDAHTVRVSRSDGPDELLQAEIILLSTGSTPVRPPAFPFGDGHFYDSDTILELDHLPRSLGIIGAGVIGCEYASVFSLLGIEVHLIDRRERILPFVDWEIGDRLRAHMEEAGVRFHFATDVTGFRVEDGTVALDLSDGNCIRVGKVLLAGGRRGAVEGLGLERLGIPADSKGHIEVNPHYRTALPSIYAVGDVIGWPSLVSTAMEQGRIAVCHAFNHTYKKQLAPILPIGIYTVPEISWVGLTEEAARAAGLDYEVGRAPYLQNARGLIIGDTSGIVKLIFAASSQTLPEHVEIPGLRQNPGEPPRLVEQQLIGVHIIGELATEIIHSGLACLYYHGTIDYFIQSVFNFPTLSEAFKYAAYDGLARLEQRLNQ
jgi:NAD(P) transhydrogenase